MMKRKKSSHSNRHFRGGQVWQRTLSIAIQRKSGPNAKDRGVKLRAYQSCLTIQEIVFVNQYTLRVEILQRNEQDDTLWNTHLYDRGATIYFSSINVDVAIEEFYQRLPALLEEDEEDEE